MADVASRTTPPTSATPVADHATLPWEDLFESLTNLPASCLDDVLIRHREVPTDTSAKAIRDRMADFLMAPRKDVTALLGTSSSQLSRYDRVDAQLLDRAYAFTHAFERVAAAIGTDGAKAWFREGNPGLDAEVPLELLRTRYGQQRVENLIEALLNGAVV